MSRHPDFKNVDHKVFEAFAVNDFYADLHDMSGLDWRTERSREWFEVRRSSQKGGVEKLGEGPTPQAALDDALQRFPPAK